VKVNSEIVGTIELQTALEGAFKRPIAALSRRPCEYYSSFSIEELELIFDDGGQMPMIFKNVGRNGLLENGHLAKPVFLYNPLREISTYETILEPAGLETAQFYGAFVDSKSERYWLFLERVPGRPLSEIGDFEHWKNVARWLARMHIRLSDSGQRAEHLIWYDRSFYQVWRERACENLADPDLLEWLHCHYDRVIERLLAMPEAVIHGDFYASNILLQNTSSALRVCPVDWEMAAYAPGLIDLAALVSGDWSDEEKASLAMAYYNEIESKHPAMRQRADFLTALDCCRLHLALQCIGSSRSWSPPPQHHHDWFQEAVRLTERLFL
jgi:hypothetical protein